MVHFPWLAILDVQDVKGGSQVAKSPSKNKSRAGKTFLHVEIDPSLRSEAKKAAIDAGVDLKDWVPTVLREKLESLGAQTSTEVASTH